jgi:glycosyltransferase involved in cell wall biosynthesis
MKIVYVAAGAAGMYCGSCLHDNTLALALRRTGDDVLLVPTYTPLRTDEEDASQRRLFYGGINVYLQQKLALFRRTPWWFDALLNRPGLIQWLASRGNSTDATGLGDLTVSMLQGESGRQRKELDKLVQWLADDVRPDVVHLSNVMLLGMARRIREALNVPVVCSLSGEDIFLEKLRQPYYDQARQLLRERASDAAAFVALNRYFADFMTDYMDLPKDKVQVIRHGLDLTGHGTRASIDDQPFTIGYLARICPEKGLHHLVDAFCELCADDALPPLLLRAAGYLGAGDRDYLQQTQQRLAARGLSDRFVYAGELDRNGKISFLQSMDVMSLPTVYHESKGLPLIEAMANAVPVVVPAHGTWPELIELTGGGILVEPDDIGSLAAGLKRMILDAELRGQCGAAGQQAVREQFTAQRMAQETRALYEQLVGS